MQIAPLQSQGFRPTGALEFQDASVQASNKRRRLNGDAVASQGECQLAARPAAGLAEGIKRSRSVLSGTGLAGGAATADSSALPEAAELPAGPPSDLEAQLIRFGELAGADDEQKLRTFMLVVSAHEATPNECVAGPSRGTREHQLGTASQSNVTWQSRWDAVQCAATRAPVPVAKREQGASARCAQLL